MVKVVKVVKVQDVRHVQIKRDGHMQLQDFIFFPGGAGRGARLAALRVTLRIASRVV